MPRLGCLGANLPFISASCPRHSPPPHSPLGRHPRFFHTPPTPLLTAPLPSRAAPAFLPHTAHATPTLRGLVSTPSRTCATSRPAARHSLRAVTAAMGTFFRKHKKTSTVPWGAVLVLGAKLSTFGQVVLTCATMGGHTVGKRVRRRGLACATCAVDLIDATLYFGIAAGESVFAHSAVAIDAAHHFAGGLFHTACGRLCGRGGRGRRRGGRARR